MNTLALSGLLSLISAVAYAGGAIVQERIAATSPDHPYAPLHRPGWWAAVGLNALGAVLHVAALAYGPLTLVQPLGALAIVFVLPLAALFVQRRARTTAWCGAIVASLGLVGLLTLTTSAMSSSLDEAQRITIALTTLGAMAALVAAARAARRHPVLRGVLLAAAAGVAFGIASVFTKTATVGWDEGSTAGQLPSLVIIGALATAGTLLSQAAYRGAGLAAPLAVVTATNPVVAVVVGLTLFGETFRDGSAGTVLAVCCGAVAVAGLIVLAAERPGNTPHRTSRPVTTGHGTSTDTLTKTKVRA
ncbi:DMT family transporter [Streptomyces beijiangensis]|uniref:DMT family transporter n=2 Tax=Streptomyces beijiangensis TaxID=163361 RepID=A0A939FEB4_9ACTN|nr:DMT family transporter [Streptomyces beijiangensis]